jgi:uncharacterized membrane protein YbhN (UPF0104 family)
MDDNATDLNSPSPEPSKPGDSSSSEHIPRFNATRILRSVIVFVLAGIALYGAGTLASDPETTMAALAAFPMRTLALVLGLVLVGWLIRGWRFHYYLSFLGYPISFRYSLAVFLAGFALTGTPGKMGEAAKGVFLKEDYRISFTQVLGILVVERLMDLWGVMVLGSFSLLLFSQWQGAFFACVAIIVSGGVLLCLENVYRPVLERVARVPFLSWVAHRVLGILLAGRQLMTVKVFGVSLVVSTAAWALESLSLYLIVRALGLPVGMLEANFVYCFSTLFGALSMLPGGIGGTEAGMMGLLTFLGVAYSQALPAVLLIRICTLWFAIGVGLLFMTGFLIRSGGAVREAAHR